ncbi:MAG: MFS transporter [Anaerolineae bacterium]|jgi:GPH family glycoside/pentoside/hexuronide:cation symporter
MEHNDKLKRSTKLIYGVGDVGNAVVNSAIGFFLLAFYTDAAFIAAGLASTALWVAKLWDAVNDPLFGWLSDRTTSRFGKRRVYMIFGALPLAVSVMLLWFVPGGLSDAAIFVWIVFTFMLFDTLWTLTNVPYYALTAELTEDYDERASLTAFRMVLGVPAYVVGAALTPVIVGLFAVERSGYGAVGVAYGLLAAGALWVAAAGIKEREVIAESKSETPPWRAFLATFKNRPFVRLIAAYLLANTAFALIRTLLYYYLTYQLDMEDQVPLVMFLLLAFVGLFLFPWKMLSDRWSKGPAYALGLAIGGGAVALTFVLPHEPTAWVYLIAVVAGIGFSANWVFPWAMVPDVVDYDRLETGEYRGGMYYGVWGLALKISEALGLAASGWVLQLYGYEANVEQTAHTLFGIRLFFGPIPGIFFVLALPLLIWYPITRKTHAEMREKLAALGE